MNKNEQGFSAVEGLLILVIVGSIGGVGYFVYQSKSKTTSSLNNTAKSQNEPQKSTKQAVEKKAEKASAISYGAMLTSLNKQFTISIPDGWTVTNDTEIDYALAVGGQNMIYKKGAPTKIVNALGHRGGGITTTSFVVQFSKDALDQYYSASKETGTIKLNNGKEGKKYLLVSDGGPDDVGTIKGTKFYGYQFKNEKGSTIINYTLSPSDSDQLEVVENVVKTLKF